MSNSDRNIIINRFISNVYNGITRPQEAQYFLANKLGIKSIEFTGDGQAIILNEEGKVEIHYYQGEIKINSRNSEEVAAYNNQDEIKQKTR